MITGITIIVAVLLLVGSGWYMNQYKPLHVTVVKVNDTDYDMNYYIDMLAYYGMALGDPSYIPYIGDQVVQAIEQNQLIKEAVDKINNDPNTKTKIVVTDDEIAKALADRKLADTPTRRDAVTAGLLTQKLLSDYFDKQVPATGEERKISAMLLESQSQVAAVKARLAKGDNFNDVAGELSTDAYSKTNKGDLDWRPAGVLSVSVVNSKVLDDAAFKATLDTVGDGVFDADATKSLGYWIVKVTEAKTNPNTAHVLRILVGSNEDALKVKDRLAKGEDFAAVAKDVSLVQTAKDDGGDTGFVAPGTMSTAVDAVVFAKGLPVNTVSDPIKDDTQQSKGGYWLIKVTGMENRPIDGQNRDTLKSQKLNDWLKNLMEDPNNKVVTFLTDDQKTFAATKAAGR
jgi:parvulin-like peptidyl-prolyl isomerase